MWDVGFVFTYPTQLVRGMWNLFSLDRGNIRRKAIGFQPRLPRLTTSQFDRRLCYVYSDVKNITAENTGIDAGRCILLKQSTQVTIEDPSLPAIA